MPEKDVDLASVLNSDAKATEQPSVAMREVISVGRHPLNTDRTATLVNGPAYHGRDIYRVRGGYIAMVGHDRCFAGVFATQADAAAAQAEAP